MRVTGIVALGLSLVVTVSCGGMTAYSPTAPTLPPASAGGTPAPAAPAPFASPLASAQAIESTVQPVGAGSPPCWADRYPCRVYDFTLEREGAIEVSLAWDGHPQAMKVQLYWAGEGLAHEDLAPRGGPSRIWFRRPLMEAHDYRLRVVSLEPTTAVPFTLTVTY